MLSIHDPLLIFTDLDGTLLNSHTFEWQPAAPWLTRLHESGVPVILCSSKTAAEMLQLQTTLNLQGLPLIAENGAVIQLDVHWEDHPNYPRLIAVFLTTKSASSCINCVKRNSLSSPRLMTLTIR